jgi:hypothetical protein
MAEAFNLFNTLNVTDINTVYGAANFIGPEPKRFNVLMQGSYGILRSLQGWIGERIVFSGFMTMIGINCEWRMTWTKTGNDQFGFINEERNEIGSWAYTDEWRFKRKR